MRGFAAAKISDQTTGDRLRGVWCVIVLRGIVDGACRNRNPWGISEGHEYKIRNNIVT